MLCAQNTNFKTVGNVSGNTKIKTLWSGIPTYGVAHYFIENETQIQDLPFTQHHLGSYIQVIIHRYYATGIVFLAGNQGYAVLSVVNDWIGCICANTNVGSLTASTAISKLPQSYGTGITIEDANAAGFSSGCMLTFKYNGIRCIQLGSSYDGSVCKIRGAVNGSEWSSWRNLV